MEKNKEMEEEKRPYWKTEAHYRATAKYERSAYAKVLLRLRNDAETSRDAVQAAADRAGESLNGYILDAIRQRMEREKE